MRKYIYLMILKVYVLISLFSGYIFIYNSSNPIMYKASIIFLGLGVTLSPAIIWFVFSINNDVSNNSFKNE